MKKLLMMPVLAAALTVGASKAAPPQSIAVSINGNPVSFPAGQPIEWKGKVMVPLRGVFEQMGGAVNWDSAAQMVTIVKEGITIKMTVGEDHALKNEETILTNARSFVRSGTCYVPLRFLSETIDANVHWDGATRAVHITTAKNIASPSSQRTPPPARKSK